MCNRLDVARSCSMTTNYKVILECKQEGKMPIITPFNLSKAQYHEIMKIVHAANNRKKDYPYGYYAGTF